MSKPAVDDMPGWMRRQAATVAGLERRPAVSQRQLKKVRDEIPDEASITALIAQALTNIETMPAGSIIEWPSDVAPGGWLLCQGQAVSRTTYASLFAIISTKFGIGDGSTTFNLPDYRGRMPVGKDATSDFIDIGSTGGVKTVTLTSAQMPPHVHVQNYYSGGLAASGTALGAMTGGAGATTASGQSTASTGGSGGQAQSHQNLPPYLTTNFAIKWTMSATEATEPQVIQRLNAYDALANGGTTAQRDAIFGTPATAAARLALHLKQAQWKRTDKGWTEQYFATTTDGATKLNGAVTAAGWYPISGKLPYAEAVSNTVYNYPTASTRVAMDAVLLQIGTEISAGIGGGTNSGQLVTTLAGRYEYNFHLLLSTGTATYIDLLVKRNGVDLTAVTSSIPNVSFWSEIADTRPNILMATGDNIQLFSGSGAAYTMQMRQQGTRIGLQYTSPPFIS